jgi:hypothetical protein
LPRRARVDNVPPVRGPVKRLPYACERHLSSRD